VKPTLPLRSLRPLREAKFAVKLGRMKPIKIVSGGQTGSGPGCAGLGADAQSGMRGMVPEGPEG